MEYKHDLVNRVIISLNLFDFLVLIRNELDPFPIYPRRTTNQRSHGETQISPGQDSDRVRLPRPVPTLLLL